MRNLPPYLLLLLASSTASTMAAADALAPTTNAPAGATPTAELEPETGESLQIEGLSGESEMEQSLDEGITYFRRGVIVRYRAMELVANQVALSQGSGDI